MFYRKFLFDTLAMKKKKKERAGNRENAVAKMGEFPRR